MRKRPWLVLYVLIPVFGILSFVFHIFTFHYIGLWTIAATASTAFDLLLLCGSLAVVYYITAGQNRSAQIEYQAYTDALTQVKNRAAFNIVLESMSASLYPNLTLIMCDLNTLKQVNDTLGHLAGDKLICSFVQYLRECFSSMGTIYRYGGDEFVLVLDNAPLTEVYEARANFDKKILEHSIHGGLNISTAMGIASRQEPLNNGLHATELLRLADFAMYQHKASVKSKASPHQAPQYQGSEQIDAVTGILTFPAFKYRMYEALTNKTVAYPCLVNFDLNFFDGYNSLFGWDAGNQLLHKLTTLALNICGKNGFCGHGDADSFWIFTDHPDLITLTRRITDETKNFQDQLGDFLLFPSFGIYCIGNTLSPVNDMCSHAVNAKRKIKGNLDSLYSVYDANDQQQQISNMLLTASLRQALDNNEFVPFFQPKYAPDGLRIVGAEALARWKQEDGSYNTPDGFKTLYEKSGLILSLDWHMLEKTCMFLRNQFDTGRRCVPISVNFSRLHVYEENCAIRLCRMADLYNLPHDLIEIELTETDLVQRIEPISALIHSIRANGFRVSLDNFGTGFSSLEILKNNQIDTVKIDRSLTSLSCSGERDGAIVSNLIALCRDLNTSTVAEGIETQTQLDIMRKYDFDMLQGRHLSPALSAQEFERLLNMTASEKNVG